MELNLNEYKQPEEGQQGSDSNPISPRADSYGQIDPYSNTNLEDIEDEDPRYRAEDLSNLPSHQEAPNPQFEYKDGNVYYGMHVYVIFSPLIWVFAGGAVEENNDSKDRDQKQNKQSTISNQVQDSRRGYSIDWNKDFQVIMIFKNGLFKNWHNILILSDVNDPDI